MAWTCTACEFTANEDGQEACVACGSERPEEEEEQQQQAAEESPPAEENGDGGQEDAATASSGGEDAPEVVVIELPAKEKLGVKLMPPKDGVIDHGLAIDNINNPLLENKVQAGDLIVAIGGQNVDGMGFSDAIDLIRKMPRPLAISFEIDEVRRQEVVREKFQLNKDHDLDTELTTYAVVFDNGPMGLNLEEAVRYGIDGAVVRALKGQAKTSGMISIGDIVYKVNETDVLCMPYLEVMNVLRVATAPKTLQFVPKDKLADVQRVNSRHSESFRLRESTSHVKQKLMNNPRIVKDDGNDGDDNQSIAQLILDNQAATIKKGRMYKQGRVMRNWKSRYFVLSVSKVEYFKSPSSTTSRGEMSFLNHRCTVRSLPGTGDVVCRSPNVTAEYLLEVRVDDRRMVMACTSESDKKGWMDAVKLAIDASKTVNRTQNLGESLREAKALRTQRTESISMDGTFLDRNAGGRLSQFNYEAFSTPVVHVGVLSATNLTKSGSSVNAICEVTVGAETFKTSVVKNQRSPVWKQDNSASFEAPRDDMVVEIRIFDEHLFRATELIATLSIPLKSLPNMQKTTKKYPLALGSRSAGAVLTLSLEYVNKQKAYEEDQERGRLGDDLNSNGMMNERDEMVKIKAEAQMAADEATHHAARAQEEAHMLLEQSRQKAEAAMAAAREEQREGKAAVEKAMAEAARAKEEAEKQLAEARRAQEEAQKLIEANRRIQESDVQGPSIYAAYRRMVQDGHSNDDVKKKMQEDGVDEMGIQAFFDGINSYDEKIRALQAEVEKLKRSRSGRPKDEPRAQDMLANLDISSDQVKLLRRLLKLEKQLQQAGIAVAADIPYEEAMAKVQEISKRMQEIGSADVTHPDPAIQKQLREEYYRLEQDMEKYNTALMLTDEYAAEEARKEREWEEENYDENIKALKAIRRMMPVDVKKMSEADLQTVKSPAGKTLPRDIARKYKRTNVLELLRMNPADIAKNHPSLLENLRVTGLSVTERRALHMHLRDIAETWKSQQGEEMTKKKYEWFKTLKETFKTVVNSYNKHVKQYGPEDNHPYATRDDPDIGCPMIGKQCPIKANKNPAYDQDLGYPDGDVYMESTVQKGNPDDAGARALAEAQELARAKLANSRADALKKHYRNVRLVAEANGVCELIDTSLDQIENRQLLWFQARLKRRLERTETAATIKVELAEFGELVNEIRLASLKFAERSGMSLSGKRNAALDAKDTRSSIECNLILLYCDAVSDCFDGMDERMDEVKASDKRLRSAIPVIRGLLKDLGDKSRDTLNSLEKGPPTTRRVKTRTEIMKEAKEKNSAAAPAETEAAEEAPGPARAPHPMMAARGRGRGRGGGRDGLFAAIAGRGGRGGDEDAPPGPPVDFLASIRGRGRGKPGGPGRGDLFSAIKARGDGGAAGGRGGDLMSAIRGRGGGGGMPGRGDFLSVIAARKKE